MIGVVGWTAFVLFWISVWWAMRFVRAVLGIVVGWVFVVAGCFVVWFVGIWAIVSVWWRRRWSTVVWWRW